MIEVRERTIHDQLLDVFADKPIGVGKIIQYLRVIGYTRRQIRRAIWVAVTNGNLELDEELKFVKVQR